MTANRFNFRVWDKENKRMIYPDGNGYFYLKNDTVITSNGELFDLVREEIVDDCVLMQSTGCLDCGGREIFEGDIIEYRNSAWQTFNYVVVYYNGGFALKDKEGEYTPFQSFIGKDINGCYEVQGNIYENKELLNEAEND